MPDGYRSAWIDHYLSEPDEFFNSETPSVKQAVDFFAINTELGNGRCRALHALTHRSCRPSGLSLACHTASMNRKLRQYASGFEGGY